jgi:hypothetical protein
MFAVWHPKSRICDPSLNADTPISYLLPSACSIVYPLITLALATTVRQPPSSVASSMENRFIITSLCAAALVYACGPWVHEQTASSSPVTPSNRSFRASTGHKAPADVATELDLARNGSRIDFALRVTNNTHKTVELRFPNARTHDIAVLDSTGKTVWRASAGRLFTQTMQALTVKSSDTLTMEDSWDTNGAHGAYTAVALLATDTHPVERRVAFTLP